MAACGTSGGDNPALSGPQSTTGRTATGPYFRHPGPLAP
jgi:hypothetical protein